MAVRLNTIKYPIGFGAVADIATVTTGFVGITSMYIAENVGVGVTFVSALLYMTWQDTSAVTGATLGEFQGQVTISGSPTTVYKDLNDLGNTGENQGMIIGPIDYTNYFNTYFGVSTVKGVALSAYFEVTTGTGTSSRGVYGWFDLTYAYDDSVANRTKTISVPYESLLNTLPTNTSDKFTILPQMIGIGGWLDGYPNIQIRSHFGHLYGNACVNSGAVDFSVRYHVDSGITTVTLPLRESALASDTFQLYQLDFSSVNLGTNNNIYIYTTLANRFHNVILDSYITFTHTGTGVTQILNYLEFPLLFSSTYNSLAELGDTIVKTVNIPESNITSRAVAVNVNYTSASSVTCSLRVGVQTSPASYFQNCNVVCGQFSFQHLADTRSRAGVGTTIVQGYNTFFIAYDTSTGTPHGSSGVLKLLYNSSPPSNIDDSSKTITSLYRTIGMAGTTIHNFLATPFYPFGTSIVNSYYFVHQFYVRYNTILALPITAGFFESAFATNSSESVPQAMIGVMRAQIGDAENAYVTYNIPLDGFNSYFGDNKLGIASVRFWKTFCVTSTRFGGTFNLCYHNIASSITGSITGSSGGTVNIQAFDEKTLIGLGTTTRVGNGNYSLIVYNPNIKYYVVASESDTLNGISTIVALPGGGFNISLVPTMPINAGYYG